MSVLSGKYSSQDVKENIYSSQLTKRWKQSPPFYIIVHQNKYSNS